MSQLREQIERHPSETTRLLGLDYDQLIELKILSEFELIVDSYEQPIERPTDYKKQKK